MLSDRGAPSEVAAWLGRDRPLALGVADRSARWAGARPIVVRVAYLTLALAGGVGVVLYGIVWLLTTGAPEPEPRARTVRADLGVAVMMAAVLAAVTAQGPQLPVVLLWLVGLASMALAITSDAGAGRAGSDRVGDGGDGAGPALRRALGQSAIGLVLVVAAVATAMVGAGGMAVLAQTTVAMLALLVGATVVLMPWLGRLTATAEDERRQRIRAEERADLAAHLHDSVLQTLTLIQNRAAEPQVVAALSHQQERELRAWLYGADRAGPEPEAASLRTAMEAEASEVEDQYLVAVETIIIGDHPCTPATTALVAAAREAMVNAAKFSTSTMVSVFVEVDASGIGIYIRDRGVGFDPASVPADRRGITQSIVARVERIGGVATVRSTPGSGTEVALTLPQSRSGSVAMPAGCEPARPAGVTGQQAER
ncbi:MAG: ATP-binding protein [Acidimicrobiales bacterium]